MELLFPVLMIAFVVFIIASLWRVFEKAGKPGWAAIVPIYNIICMCEIAGKPAWWFILFLIPIVSLIVSIIVVIDLAKAFGKGVGFALGLIFLPFIFYPILGFGDAEYIGV